MLKVGFMKNKIKNILFDLDGTLIQGDQDEFFEIFFKEVMMKYLKQFGGDPNTFKGQFMYAYKCMAENSGKMTNDEMFYRSLAKATGNTVKKLEDFFVDFYANEYKNVKFVNKAIPQMIWVLKYLHDNGYNIILATDPLIPDGAIEFKLSACGVDKKLFSFITSSSNSKYSKVSLDYYTEIIDKQNLRRDETIMVGNHADKDNLASEAGVKTILISDYLVNYSNKKLDNLMSADEFKEYVIKEF